MRRKRKPRVAWATASLRRKSSRCASDSVAAYGTRCAAMIAMMSFLGSALPDGVVVGPRAERRGAAALPARVAVDLVVVADVDDVLVALGCRREGGEPDVVGAAVAGPADGGVRLVVEVVHAAHAGRHGRGAGERRGDRGHPVGAVGERARCGDRAARRHDQREHAAAQRLVEPLQPERHAAAGAGAVARPPERLAAGDHGGRRRLRASGHLLEEHRCGRPVARGQVVDDGVDDGEAARPCRRGRRCSPARARPRGRRDSWPPRSRRCRRSPASGRGPGPPTRRRRADRPCELVAQRTAGRAWRARGRRALPARGASSTTRSAVRAIVPAATSTRSASPVWAAGNAAAGRRPKTASNSSMASARTSGTASMAASMSARWCCVSRGHVMPP